jgi:hypothetical protein
LELALTAGPQALSRASASISHRISIVIHFQYTCKKNCYLSETKFHNFKTKPFVVGAHSASDTPRAKTQHHDMAKLYQELTPPVARYYDRKWPDTEQTYFEALGSSL